MSAFAEGTADDTTKETLLKGGENITDSGTYQLNGPYTKGITINTTGSVVINVTGNVTVTAPENEYNFCFITIEKADSVTINDAAKYPVTVNGGSVISNLGEELIVNGGTYIRNGGGNPNISAFTLANGSNQVEKVTIESKYNAILVSSDCDSAVIKKSEITKQYNSSAYEGGIVCRTTNGTLDLDHVTVHALEGSALQAESGTITINGGEYKSKSKVRLLLLRLISMIIWILRLTAELIKMIIITGLLQILGAMWVVMAEIVILKFMEARLLAANCCGFMVRVPKR